MVGSLSGKPSLACAPLDAEVVLDAEHDRFEWVAADQAPARCLADLTRLPLESAIQRISDLGS
jgi:hypothetical protein